ncbi:MAG: DMT family transporter, partial [Pseudomonadota bacterium]
FGMIGGTGHFLLILAFRSTQASILAPFNYVSLLYSILWGFLFFNELPDMATLAGATIIIGSGLYVWYRERQQENRG